MTASPRGRGWLTLPVLAAVAVVGAVVIKSFVAQAFYIPSGSMVPQLRINDRLVVSRLAYRLHRPRRGDIVVFEAPPSEQPPAHAQTNLVTRVVHDAGEAVGAVQARTEFVKRVVALPGETVEGRDGRVYVNGQYLYEPYLPPGVTTSTFGPVTVGPDHLWVMGDARTDSTDSRSFGTIPIATVIGRALWRVWPPGRVSFL